MTAAARIHLQDPALAPASEPALAPYRAPINPFVGLVQGARQEPLEFFTGFGVEHDLVELPSPFGRFYLVNRPEVIEHILERNHKNFPKSEFYQRVRYLFGDGLFELEGETWKRKRQMVHPWFRRDFISSLATMMTTEIGRLLDDWQGHADKGEVIAVNPPLMKMALNVVSQALCSRPVSGDMEKATEALAVVMKQGEKVLWSLAPAVHRLPTPQRYRVEKAVRCFDETMYGVIRERLEMADEDRPGDLLDKLLTQKTPAGEPVPLGEIRDDLLTMLVAGHETTAVAITWASAMLSRHPEIRARVRAEVDAVLGGRVPTAADLPALPLTAAAFQEALRLYPPFWTISRRALEDDEVMGWRIPAGATLMISPYVTHRNPRFWSNPEAFDPTRFLGEAPARRTKYAYLPFGGGPRVCLGRQFALMEGTLYLAMLVQRYDLDLEPGQKLEAEAMISLRPKRDIRMRVLPRS